MIRRRRRMRPDKSVAARPLLRMAIPGNGRRAVREEESDTMRRCQIVDAHYFRGRLAAMEAAVKDSLLNERLFEDVLMKEGVITHSLPLVRRRDQSLAEKGLDVWFALETYELALLKRYDVTVLVACDRDYLPLVRKLNTLGGLRDGARLGFHPHRRNGRRTPDGDLH